jgi:hypothetical protein
MRYKLVADLEGLAAYLPRFLELAGQERWRKRAVQLAERNLKSPPHAKIVADYHWLEMDLSHQIIIRESLGCLVPEEVDLKSLAALYFAGTVVEVHGRLTSKGRTALEGRIRDALKAETGFASLYLEMEMAQRLLGGGYNVEFPDLDGTDRYDLQFGDGSSSGEVECKSLSADAGRKIHRKDFYRFIDEVSAALTKRAADGNNEVLIITLQDRLPPDTASQTELRAAAVQMAGNGPTSIDGSFFRIEREDYAARLYEAPLDGQARFYKACCNAFGPNCHVSGAITPDGQCLVVMRSRREDDHSKPLLEALRKGASQLSGTRPGFIAVQFDDITTEDLMLPHLRRRAGILSCALFGHYGASHVAATFFCVYGGLSATKVGIGAPAFALPNPQPKFELDAEAQTFLGHIPDAEFAELLGAPLPAEGISQIPFSDEGA